MITKMSISEGIYEDESAYMRVDDKDDPFANKIHPFLGQTSKEEKKGIPYVVLLSLCFSVLSLGTSVFSLVIRSHRPGHQDKAEGGMCLTCPSLQETIDRWAWPEGIEDTTTGMCCFRDEYEIAKTLKYYVDKRFSSLHEDVEWFKQKLERLDSTVWDLVGSGNSSVSASRSQDIERLVKLIQKMFHKERAVLHLTSQRMTIDKEPKIVWNKEVRQGSLALNEDGKSVNITDTGLYFISTQIKFRSFVPQNQTRNTTVQFYLASVKEGRLGRVDDYKKCYVFQYMMAEHDAVLHTVTRLEKGENLIIRFPISQKHYLATDHASHRLSIFELS